MTRKSSFGFIFGIPILLAIIMGIVVVSVIGVIVYYFVTKNNTTKKKSSVKGYSSSDFTRLVNNNDVMIDWTGGSFNDGKNDGPASSLDDCVTLFNKAIDSGIKPAPTFFLTNGTFHGSDILMQQILYHHLMLTM